MTTPTASTAALTFLPWVRQGVATAITTVDTLGPKQPGVVDLTAALTIKASPAPPGPVPVPVRLRGPADVVGIDTNQIVRMDPHPGANDFEPTYFPCVEFDRADFPWLFTPAKADSNAKLRPWLCLIVVRKQDGVTLGATVDAPLTTLQIAAPARPGIELPNLLDSWAWAHAQAAATDSTPANVRVALDGAPELSLSRLICPRILAPDTDYIAAVVPTFELGRKAGLGLPILDSDLVATSALAPAWSLSPAPAQVLLPVYHHWEFRTGAGGDFASLVGRLRPRPAPPELGRKPIDISRPGFALDIRAGTTLEAEGALRPVPPTGSLDASLSWPDATEQPFQDALLPIVNAPGVNAVLDPGADPLLAPPLYGRWQASRAIVARTGTDWFDQLNLDPRLRSVAAFGTRVVQEHQEALMASAWEQAGELQRANQRMRQLQLSLAVGDRLHARHLSMLNDDAKLRVTAPVLSRIGLAAAGEPGTYTLMAKVGATTIPMQALSPTMRRIGRERGPLTRRVIAQGATRFTRGTWVTTLYAGTANLPVSSWFDLITIGAVCVHMVPKGTILPFPAVGRSVIADRGGAPWFVVRAEGQAIPLQYSYTYGSSSYDSASARAFRAAAIAHLTRVNPGRQVPMPILPNIVVGALSDLTDVLSQGTRPGQTVRTLAQGLVAAGAHAAQSNPPAATSVDTAADSGVDTFNVVPAFPQPMYEPLRDLSQDLMLPGLDAIEADSVLGLETNRRFVEAYMVGLNFEMGRELLWRGFPTNQLGTYFDRFWGGAADIEPLHLWGNRPLGDSATATPRENFVMLLRSALLRRFPNAVVYLTPAVFTGGVRRPSEVPADEKSPVFSGAMQPDINFFGFDVPADRVNGSGGSDDGGYYIVIQQHPTEPRFGLHTGVSAGSASHVTVGAGAPAGQPLNGLTWGQNAAHMAGITRRLPVRLAIHASQFLSPAFVPNPKLLAARMPLPDRKPTDDHDSLPTDRHPLS